MRSGTGWWGASCESQEVVPSLDPERHRGSGHPARRDGAAFPCWGFLCRAGAAPVPPGGRVTFFLMAQKESHQRKRARGKFDQTSKWQRAHHLLPHVVIAPVVRRRAPPEGVRISLQARLHAAAHL